MKNIFKILIILFIFNGCTANKQLKKQEESFVPISYIEQLNQDEKLLMDEELQNYKFEKFKKEFFRPWDENRISIKKEYLLYSVNRFKEKTVYGENKKIVEKDEKEKLFSKVQDNSFPNYKRKAIVINSTLIRGLPTNKPFYYDFNLAGEGYPFDYLQVSAIWANTPIYILHKSLDGKWVYIDSSVCQGWVLAKDIAFVDDVLIKKYKMMGLSSLINDKIIINDKNNNYYEEGRIGMIFPTDSSLVYGFYKNREGYAKFIELSGNEFVKLPLKATNHNMIRVIKSMLGQKYGWGGTLFNRDCSSTLKDYFAIFGIMLPRNSLDQLNEGTVIKFGINNKDKPYIIKKYGDEFLTVLYQRGHIMLYVGFDDKNKYIFHNIWGLKQKKKNGRIGRYIIGKTVITKLNLGKGIKNVPIESIPIKKIEAIGKLNTKKDD